MKTLAMLTMTLAMLASIQVSFAEPANMGHGSYPGKPAGEYKKCKSPFDYRCSTSNG
jgi:hypothetical protein